MPWFEWSQSDLPCEFSDDRTQDNRRFLERILGDAFINGRGTDRGSHPLQNEWDNTGANSFIQVNALAEDLRLLDGKLGIAPVLHDLRDNHQCLPTWHLLHTAALFERARAGSVLEFVPADGHIAPDLVVDIAGDRVPVEAKLLTQSEDEVRFFAVANRIRQALSEPTDSIPVATAVRIILKQPVTVDISGDVIHTANEAIREYQKTEVCFLRRHC